MEFKNFCKSYIKSLSYADPSTLDIQKLGYEAATHTPRLREPVFCYAYAEGRISRLLDAVKDYDIRLYQEYEVIYTETEQSYNNFFIELVKVYESGYFTSDMSYNGPRWLPKEYAKVYHAWKVYTNRKEDLQKSKNDIRAFFIRHNIVYPKLTAYKIIKDLNLDFRNTYAFLKGDNSKISLSVAHRIFYYIVDFVEKNGDGNIITLSSSELDTPQKTDKKQIY